MKISQLFHVVKNQDVNVKQAFWEACVGEASSDPAGVAVGMAKIAIDTWAESVEQGRAPLVSRAEREAFATSFGSSVVAHRAAEKLAADGVITDSQRKTVQAHIAVSALNDLAALTKSADVYGAQPGDAPPGRGIDPMTAGQGAMPEGGAPEVNQSPETIGQPMAEQAGMVEDLDRAQNTIKNLLFLANQVQRPALAQQIQEQADMLLDHFSKGNNYLPPEFQHHFSDSAHAAEFLKKYQQRFGPLGAKSSSRKSG